MRINCQLLNLFEPMKSFIYYLATFLLLTIPADCLYAQTTHAHSTSRQWKGIDVDGLLENPDADFLQNGKKIYLYNVGTGRFAIEGGTWGMEARLFYEDFGRQMILRKAEGKVRIDPLVVEQNNADKRSLICNVPTVTRDNGWVDANVKCSFTTILDGPKAYEHWHFVRVEEPGSNSEYHTYYMYQQHNKKYKGLSGIQFYLGAAYGEWCSDGTLTYSDGTPNDKGNGYYVHLDDDRSCWTTAGQATSSDLTLPYKNEEKVLVNGDMVPIKELYQWRIISEDEFNSVLNEEVVGLNPSISSLVPDRDFMRNSNDFYPYWVVSPASTTPASGEGRYGYTWGNYQKNTNQKDNRYFEEAWDAPVRLKKAFQDIKKAKFGFMSFEGIGTVSVTFKLPLAGWYQIESCAVNFGPDNHNAYMYAQAGGVTLTDEQMQSNVRARYGYGEVELLQKSAIDDINIYEDITFPNSKDRKNEDLNLAIGQVLTFHGDDYRRKFLVYVDPQNFRNGGDFEKLTIGFRKDNATRNSKPWTKDGKNYFYDTDWLCADDIKVSYMGLAPAFLYEDEEDLQYLVYDENKIEERPSAQPDGRYSGALCMERTLQKGKWNSFSCPVPLTGEQIRSAFGEDAVLAKLNSIGGMSQNSNVIDFETVELKPTDPLTKVVEPGKFYLLWPTADPITGEDPLGREKTYYSLGRNFFSVNPDEDENYKPQKVNTSVFTENYTVSSYKNANDGEAFVCYVRTPGYSDFTVNGDGEYDGTTDTKGVFAPNGSYVVSGGKFYEINKDTRIKGFRGWIKLDHSIFDGPSASVKMAFDGVIDNGEGINGIDMSELVPIPVSSDTAVYDLSGIKVGVVGDQLKKGIYIVRGKKFVVK